jgi:hypothetical protein
MKTTAMSRVRACALSRRQVSKPSMPDISTSSRITSGWAYFARSIASVPSSAISTRKPRSARPSMTTARAAGVSSTIRMEGGPAASESKWLIMVAGWWLAWAPTLPMTAPGGSLLRVVALCCGLFLVVLPGSSGYPSPLAVAVARSFFWPPWRRSARCRC